VLQARAARDLTAMFHLWGAWTHYCRSEGNPDFLAFEIMMDACAAAKRPDLVVRCIIEYHI
jgi:hypothetical protein